MASNVGAQPPANQKKDATPSLRPRLDSGVSEPGKTNIDQLMYTNDAVIAPTA